MDDEIFAVAICDDQNEFLTQLTGYCDELLSADNIPHNIYTYPSGDQLLSHINSHIDLLFLDIEMPGINGIDVLKKIVSFDNIWRVVFITSHIDMWNNAFSIKTIGYENKPVTKEVISKYIRMVLDEKRKHARINLEYGKPESSVRVSDIMYINGASNYTEVHTDRKKVVLSITLKEFEEAYKEYPFLRVHKSYIVNMLNIRKISDTVELSDSITKIPVGRKYRDYVKEQYYEFLLNSFRRHI